MNESDFIPYAVSTHLGSGPVLVFAPHPDDEVFGCAGALVQHAAAGGPVHVIIVTDGAWMEGGEYAAQRSRESRAAAAVLGYGEPVFWGLPDRSLQYGDWLIQRVIASIEEYLAEWVYAPSSREIHPDHRALALAVAEAVRRCDRPVRLVMYEVGVPLQPNRLLDITALRERKQQAMACFASQLERQAYDSHVTALNRYRTYTLPPEVEFAEAYRIVSGDELRDNPVAALRQDSFAAPGWSTDASLTLPLVSVVIRSVARPGLSDTLDTVALQTYPHIEIIVVAPERCAGTLPGWWGRFRLRSIVAEQPLSRAGAFNLGMERAEGRYLALMDEDCRLLPDHIASLAALLHESGHIRCACAGVTDKGWDGSDIEPLTVGVGASHVQKLRGQNLLPLHAVLFERTLFTEGCRFDEDLKPVEDWDFLLQLGERIRMGCGRQVTLDDRGVNTEIPDGGDTGSDSSAIIYEKWRTIWSGEQWARIIGYRDARSEQRTAVLQRQLDDSVGQAAALRRQVAEKDDEINSIRYQLAELETAVRRALADNASLSAWGSGLQQAVAQMRASASWQLTRPLRLFTRLVRGG